MSFDKYLVVHSGWSYAVAGLDLIGVADRIAGQLGCRRAHPFYLCCHPVASGRCRAVITSGAKRYSPGQIGEKLTGVVDEPLGRCDRFCLHDIGQSDRSVVGIDESIDVATETKSQGQVVPKGTCIECALGHRFSSTALERSPPNVPTAGQPPRCRRPQIGRR